MDELDHYKCDDRKTIYSAQKTMLDYATLTEQVKALKNHLSEHDIQLNQIYDTLESLLDQKAEQQTWKTGKNWL
ncbi:MAG: hypothetical protein WDO16_23985 [Bacteroidota bacterium]